MVTPIALLVLGASLPLGAGLVIDAVAHLFQVSPAWGAFWTKVTGRKRRLGLAATLAWMQALAAVMQIANQGIFTVLVTVLVTHLQRLRDHAPALLLAATPAATAPNSNSTVAPNSKAAPTSATGSPGIAARRASTGTALAASSPSAAAASPHATTMTLVEAILHDQALRFVLVVLCYLLTAALSIAGAWPASLSVVAFTLQNYLCMITATARVTTARPGMSAAPSNSTGGTSQGCGCGGHRQE
ncbi:hypothetical protein AMAG_15214 [Allomyces macrogynus ATCC 38327]|uniref:Solute carrier family 40 protein n=1 Tax=Allomyces macrogynus (strain ATCC 38327) TaxID=578462 RepID=A0A0L0T894_ALLM3|nr:hypothetical protein AMAG_15214 [Allomyces macrogynus ATCC 38327]|eukprot:KNE70950.1 hypothetical protein AMAG_15214 [Allomyces macrogynus ATCC 38327]